MLRWQRLLTTWAVPIVMILAYSLLVHDSGVTGLPAVLLLVVFVAVILLWFMFRQMSLHASLVRAAAVGDPDTLVELAAPQANGRRGAKYRLPFQIYLAIADEQRGDFAASLTKLAALRPQLGDGHANPWALIAARTEIAALLETGELAQAHTRYQATFVAAAGRPGTPAELFSREAHARLQLADGDHESARKAFRGLADDIRLGPSARAVALTLAARCADLADDSAAAARDRAASRRLAPNLWTARDGIAPPAS